MEHIVNQQCLEASPDNQTPRNKRKAVEDPWKLVEELREQNNALVREVESLKKKLKTETSIHVCGDCGSVENVKHLLYETICCGCDIFFCKDCAEKMAECNVEGFDCGKFCEECDTGLFPNPVCPECGSQTNAQHFIDE